MGYILILAAGATFLTGPKTDLTAVEASDLGIEIVARNFDYELMDEPAPLFLQLQLSGFTACQVRSVDIDALNESGTLVYGSSIAKAIGQVYAFRLDREYLDFTQMAISCDSSPTVNNHVYLFNLGELVQARY